MEKLKFEIKEVATKTLASGKTLYNVTDAEGKKYICWSEKIVAFANENKDKEVELEVETKESEYGTQRIIRLTPPTPPKYDAQRIRYNPDQSRTMLAAYAKDLVVALIEQKIIIKDIGVMPFFVDFYRTMYKEVLGKPEEIKEPF
jgi:hypothetical protein